MTDLSNLSFTDILSRVTEIIVDNARSPIHSQSHCKNVEWSIPPLVPYGKCGKKSSCCQLQPSSKNKRMRNKHAKKVMMMNGSSTSKGCAKPIHEMKMTHTLRNDRSDATVLTSNDIADTHHIRLSSPADCAPKKPCRVLSIEQDVHDSSTYSSVSSTNISITRNVSASSFAAILERRRNTKITSFLKLLDISRTKDCQYQPTSRGNLSATSTSSKIFSSASASAAVRAATVTSDSVNESIFGSTANSTMVCSDYAPKKPHRVISNHSTLDSLINETLSMSLDKKSFFPSSSSQHINHKFSLTSTGSDRTIVVGGRIPHDDLIFKVLNNKHR